MKSDGSTLTEALAKVGCTHRKAEKGLYRHDVLLGDLVIFTGTAAEVWAWTKR